MSYFQGTGAVPQSGRRRTILIARDGLGGVESCGPSQEWDGDCTFNGVKGQCVPTGTKGKNPACTYPSGGVLSTIGGWLSGAAKGALTVYGSSKESAGAAEAYKQLAQQQQQQRQTPGWVLPVVIGGVGIAAVVLLTKRRR